jgi:hypothetical protein
VLWSSKKKKLAALSTAEAEYVAAGACCAQLLWMKQTLSDYVVSLVRFHSCVTMRVPSS